MITIRSCDICRPGQKLSKTFQLTDLEISKLKTVFNHDFHLYIICAYITCYILYIPILHLMGT